MGINYNKINWACAILIAILTSCVPSKEELEAREALNHPLGPDSKVVEGVYRLPSANQNLSNNQYVNITMNKHEYMSGWGGIYHGGPFVVHKGECKECERRNIFLMDSIIRTALNSCILKRKN